jgi:hypothetical protein
LNAAESDRSPAFRSQFQTSAPAWRKGSSSMPPRRRASTPWRNCAGSPSAITFRSMRSAPPVPMVVVMCRIRMGRPGVWPAGGVAGPSSAATLTAADLVMA